MTQKASLDDIFLWPDGTYATREDVELGEYSHMSDDYKVLFVDSPEWNDFFETDGDEDGTA